MKAIESDMKAIDSKKLALEDIASRPEVTGDFREELPEKNNESIVSPAQMEIEPDRIELASGRVIGKAVDDLKALYGMSADKDFSDLFAQTMGGVFSAVRIMSGRGWVRYAVAGGALAISFIPAALKYREQKKAEQNAS
jgi:hypothetical protein